MGELVWKIQKGEEQIKNLLSRQTSLPRVVSIDAGRISLLQITFEDPKASTAVRTEARHRYMELKYAKTEEERAQARKWADDFLNRFKGR